MRTMILYSVVSLTIGAASVANADSLAEITRSIEGTTRRASSGLFDPESNQGLI